MNVVIMRHGHAEAYVSSDESRNLTDRGRAEARAAGRCLDSLGMRFDEVWVSPYVRAQQTADEVLASVSAEERLTIATITPEGRPGSFVDSLAAFEGQNLLVVSHNPFVSALLGLLVDGAERYGPPMAPASMALLQAEDVLAGCCEPLWLRHAPNFDVSAG